MRIVFVTGTRADYGKLKPLMQICDADESLETHIYVTGMHLLDEYGLTYNDILRDGYEHIHTPPKSAYSEKMDENLAFTILAFSTFVRWQNPDLIVVHGDRTEPLAAAIVGVLNNVRVAHIEGGEVTGTADEFMRHAISKLSRLHFVANDESKYRLIQLGERECDIHVIGSPDIDVMLTESYLPQLIAVKARNKIKFDEFAVFIYHPVTTSANLQSEIAEVVSAVIESGRNYIVIAPNNDHGCDVICKESKRFEEPENNPRFLTFKSIVFEDFLVLLKNCEFIIGNSSAGVREACVYGIPAIDIGTRQNKRYIPEVLRNIQHVPEKREEILAAIGRTDKHRHVSYYFGDGKSAERFLEVVKKSTGTETNTQKSFVELNVTSEAIMNYINEVCF
jgi:UDP-N-acetylglucosamine 2-epimerase (hydrolysing)